MRLERVCGAAVLLVSLVLQCGEALQCRLYPVNYTFVTADVQREPEVEAGCNNAGTNYTVCSTPSRLTDSQLGPQHNPIDNSSYYIFQGSAQSAAIYYILFTFDQTVYVSNFTLHYFVHNQGGSQPVVTAFNVRDDFELQNIQSVNMANTIRLTILRPPSPYRGLHSASTQGGPTVFIFSSKVILEINAGFLYLATSFCLSEVEFFTNTSAPCPEPPTTSSTPATTDPTTDPPTTEPPTTATGPTTDPPAFTTEPPTTATAANTASLPSATPPASNETATGIAAGVTAALLVAIVALVVTTAVAVGVAAHRRRRRTRGGKGAGVEMDQNQCYATTTTHSKMTTPPSSGETVYDDIIIASNEENVYEPIPA